MNSKTISNSSSATHEELVELACRIHAEAVAGVKADELYKKYHDFAISFPIVLNWMVYENLFYAKVFRKYLRLIKAPIWRTHQAFLESQADYMCMVLRHTNPGSKDINKFRAEAIQTLNEEHALMEAADKEAQRLEKESNDEVRHNRRQRLYEQLAHQL